MRIAKHLAWVVGLLLLLLMSHARAASGQGPGARPATGAATLRGAAGDRVQIGAAIMSHHLDDPRLSKLIGEQFNSLTAENEFKPTSLHPEPDKFSFDAADKIARFAQQHDMKLIGHTLLWHHQAPGWMFADENRQPLPRERALANLQAHIDAVVKHFKGKVIGWDVVNEAISDTPGEYLRDMPARRAIGDDYVVETFKLAQAADPDAELYYNDYSIENPDKRGKTMRLLRELKSAGVRIDAVGIQGHWLVDGPDIKVIDDAITQFAGLGLKVMITELDVDVLPRRRGGADVSAKEQDVADPYKSGLPPQAQQRLAKRYGELFQLFARHTGTVTRVTFWGTHDGTSWLNNWPSNGRTNHPLLWDRQLKPKPAFYSVIQALE